MISKIFTNYIFNILIIANSIGITKINITIEYNNYLFNWKIPQILIIIPNN